MLVAVSHSCGIRQALLFITRRSIPDFALQTSVRVLVIDQTFGNGSLWVTDIVVSVEIVGTHTLDA